DLDAEIVKKRKAGYPLDNIIFEDTERAVLYQNGVETMRVTLDTPQHVADLLNAFFAHNAPHHEDFQRAVDEFKERVPELAKGLVGKIREAHENNTAFQQAFDQLYRLCSTSLNPNIAREAVDEMLVQHLLTERLIRTVFGRDNFSQQNIIAQEVEKVIQALVSHSFSRSEFLKSLDRFYVAIEKDAAAITDFREKQHFINTVYERFFQGYSVKTADTHGIVYTPQPIVDFMTASVDHVLRTEFDTDLGGDDVVILDPCTGTGNFIVNLLDRIPKEKLADAYRHRLFANEVMLLPYYIAALNIEHRYYELTGSYEPFDGLCFVDTLDMAEERQFSLFTEENTERVKREKDAPITVIIGNPPYNAHQVNENDNRKNRPYDEVEKNIRNSYAKDSSATNKNALYDPYVKFFRWAVDRLGNRDGIVCFVSNNSFVDQFAFDGMRKHLQDDFTRVYHVDLHGNVRLNPKLSGTTHNVFGIQVGVGITIAVRRKHHERHTISYHRVGEEWRKEEKYAWLSQAESIAGVEWTELQPDARNTWLVPEGAEEFAAYLPIGDRDTKGDVGVEAIFRSYSRGVATCRDMVVYDFDLARLKDRMDEFSRVYNAEVARYQAAGSKGDIDDFVDYSQIKWSLGLKNKLKAGNRIDVNDDKFRKTLYRPFTSKYLFFDSVANEALYLQYYFFPTPDSERENRVITVSDIASRAPVWTALVSDRIVDLHLCASVDSHQCFPFYVYAEDGTNRRENVTDWAASAFRAHYHDETITKWDIFWYVYAVLHHPGYREKFADNLKKELPRIPYASDFRLFADAGRALGELHLGYETVEPWRLEHVWADDMPISWRVEKMRVSKDKRSVVYNDALTLTGIPEEAYGYRLGNRSALEWVIDQYRVKTDARSGIVHDPNGYSDDPQYIVKLLGRVVRVSVETVGIVARTLRYATGSLR
ncbi:MAG TPA: DNA helicase, partial [Firmicutes bacterium]|nr:DNA helicase [Bacillota bacterium]